ncbi:MAG: hypothetical protein GC164_05180 [Phycisphaera sp.]|nr:hypothetical protein [Phycisphaera sp.]
MSIPVTCTCGKTLRAPDTLAGKRARCPKCGRALDVPPLDTADDPDVPILVTPATAPNDPPASSGTSGTGEIDLVSTKKSKPAEPGKTPAKKCVSCGAPMSPGATLCVQCGFNSSSGSFVKAVQEEHQSTLSQVMWMILGNAKLIVLAILALVVVAGTWWYVTGPGSDVKIVYVEPSDALTLYKTIGVEEPFDLLRGGSGVGGPAFVSIGSGLPGQAKAENSAYGFGSTDRVILTKPNPDGDHLLVVIDIGNDIINRKKQTSNYELFFNEDTYKIAPHGGTPKAGRLLYRELPGHVSLSQAAQSSDHTILFPADVEPTDLKTEKSDDALKGTATFDGSNGVVGKIDFIASLPTPDFPLNRGVTGQGRLEWKNAHGLSASAEYGMGLTSVSWTAGERGWVSRSQYVCKEAGGMLTKYRVAILFERPKDAGKLDLYFVDEKIATISNRPTKPTPAAPQPPPAPPVMNAGSGTGYLDMMVRARDKGRTVVVANNMQQIATAIQLYQLDNNNQFPPTLTALKKYVPNLDQVLVNPRTGRNPGFVYDAPQAPLGELKDAANTPILYEMRSDGTPAGDEGVVLYADGHLDIPE